VERVVVVVVVVVVYKRRRPECYLRGYENLRSCILTTLLVTCKVADDHKLFNDSEDL